MDECARWFQNDPGLRRSPYQLYARLRADASVHFEPSVGVYVVSRHEDIRDVLTDPTTFSSAHLIGPQIAALAALEPLTDEQLGYLGLLTDSIGTADGAAHARIRSLINRAFTAAAVRRIEPRIAALRTELLDKLPADGEVEFVGAVAVPLTIRVIAEILGVPSDDVPLFRSWTDGVVALLDRSRDPRAALRAYLRDMAAFTAYLTRRFDEVRAAPNASLLSDLVRFSDQDGRCSPAELLSFCLVIVLAGNETTVNLLASAMLLLATEPGALDRLPADPAGIPALIEEVLRVESPIQAPTGPRPGTRPSAAPPSRRAPTCCSRLAPATGTSRRTPRLRSSIRTGRARPRPPRLRPRRALLPGSGAGSGRGADLPGDAARPVRRGAAGRAGRDADLSQLPQPWTRVAAPPAPGPPDSAVITRALWSNEGRVRVIPTHPGVSSRSPDGNGGDRVYAEERQQEILRRARSEGRVDVVGLAEEMAVTSETIRRDLTVLERAGVLRRVHGGAIPIERLGFEPALAARDAVMITEKERIGKAALAELPTHGAVIIDAGSTTARLVDALPSDYEVTAVVNSPPLATTLAMRPNVTVIMLGGRVRGRTLATVDDMMLRPLQTLHVDVAFMATNGISVKHGLTTPDPAEASAKRAMIAAARRSVLLADHTKVGNDYLAQFGRLADVDVLITDSGLDDAATEELERAGLRVLRV
jgi:DeoR family transcriptional regulator, fructose operon transcriptional repressor